MAVQSSIEWTEATWNPTTGCTKVSSGCKYCYAEALTRRFETQWGQFNEVKIHEHRLAIPLRRRKPTIYFVNSMSDLFHDDVPESFIQRVFDVMRRCPHHTFQILTKRSQRLAQLSSHLNWSPNIWMGVSIENAQVYQRIDDLRRVPARVKFLSVEPLLSSVRGMNLSGIDWVIVGGESGRRARLMQTDWVIEVRDLCKKQGVPFFFKQWGGTNKKKNGRLLQGREHNAMPGLTVLSDSHSKAS